MQSGGDLTGKDQKMCDQCQGKKPKRVKKTAKASEATKQVIRAFKQEKVPLTIDSVAQMASRRETWSLTNIQRSGESCETGSSIFCYSVFLSNPLNFRVTHDNMTKIRTNFDM